MQRVCNTVALASRLSSVMGKRGQRVGGTNRPRSLALVAVLGATYAPAKDVLELWYINVFMNQSQG